MATSAFLARTGLVVVNNGVLLVNTSVMSLFSNGMYFTSGKLGINTNSISVTLHVFANDGILIPVGNTGQRPSAANGIIRYNQQTNRFEAVANNAYVEINTDLKVFNAAGTQIYPTP